MNIRRATALDVSELACLERLQPQSAQWGEKGWKTEIIQAASYVFCMEEDKKLIGFAALRLAAGFGEILNVAVHPDYCRRGIGFQLLSRLVQYARSQGGEELTLEVNIYNRAAISLYSKIGFSEIGRREKFYHNKEDALIMGITL